MIGKGKEFGATQGDGMAAMSVDMRWNCKVLRSNGVAEDGNGVAMLG
jgi:hypothetical protein